MTETAINTQTAVAQNPYACMQTNMAHDFFGSQVFGTSQNFQRKAAPSFMGRAPESIAEYIIQQDCIAKGMTPSGAQGPTSQDYIMASQIAAAFSGRNALPPQNNFIKNDCFANSVFCN